jgi:hypothetical protein
MKNIFSEIEGGLSSDEIAGIERDAGYIFPDDFKMYLSNINGGWVKHPSIFPLSGGGETGVRVLYGYNCSPGKDIRKHQANMYYVPRCLLPIGDDLGGNDLFVLDLRSEALGHVYIRSITEPPTSNPFLPASLFDDSDEAELYHNVAPTFSQFLGLVAARPDATGKRL